MHFRKLPDPRVNSLLCRFKEHGCTQSEELLYCAKAVYLRMFGKSLFNMVFMSEESGPVLWKVYQQGEPEIVSLSHHVEHFLVDFLCVYGAKGLDLHRLVMMEGGPWHEAFALGSGAIITDEYLADADDRFFPITAIKELRKITPENEREIIDRINKDKTFSLF